MKIKLLIIIYLLSFPIYIGQAQVIQTPTGDQYLNILERTNQQLNHSYAPLSIAIAILSILFTVLTIVAAILIYRQGSDYKKRLNEDREEYKRKIDSFISEQEKLISDRSEQVKSFENKIDETLTQYKNKLKQASEQQKNEIEDAIEKLEIEKATLQSKIGPITVSPEYIQPSWLYPETQLNSKRNHKCSKCGFGFYVKNPTEYDAYSGASPLTSPHLGMTKTVVCPKCGNVDELS